MHGTYRRPIGNDTGKIELIGTTQFIQQHKVQLAPYAGLLPGTHPVPPRHTRATLHFRWEHFPQNSRLQSRQDIRQYAPVVQRRVGKMRPALLPDRKQWRGYFPQFIINQFGCLIAWPLNHRRLAMTVKMPFCRVLSEIRARRSITTRLGCSKK